MISRYKTGKHFSLTITDTSLAIERRQDRIDAEAALDGFYVLRTPVPASQLDGPAVVAADKNLARVERDFRSIKSDDLDLRPVFCRLEKRVRAHVLICMLACYLTSHGTSSVTCRWATRNVRRVVGYLGPGMNFCACPSDRKSMIKRLASSGFPAEAVHGAGTIASWPSGSVARVASRCRPPRGRHPRAMISIGMVIA